MKYVLETQCPKCRSQSLLNEVGGVESVWVCVHALLTPSPPLNKILAKNPLYPSATLASSLHLSSCLEVLLWHRFIKIKQT